MSLRLRKLDATLGSGVTEQARRRRDGGSRAWWNPVSRGAVVGCCGALARRTAAGGWVAETGSGFS
jgi:hypothetical protein